MSAGTVNKSLKKPGPSSAGTVWTSASSAQVADGEARAPEGLRALRRELLEQPRNLLVLRLTLLLLILFGATRWTLEVPLRIACGAMLISSTLLFSRWMWLGVSGILIAANLHDWDWIDNHKYVITYWTLACTLAVATRDRGSLLAHNARWILALVFAFAFGWKLLGQGYLDGSFLHHTFLTDPRVETPVRWASGLSAAELSGNRLAESMLRRLPSAEVEVTLETTPVLRRMALTASYWTLGIECLVALAFLLPNTIFGRWRDLLLMGFILTTYFLLPVVGFAFVLALMGLAQCPVEKPRMRIAYLCLLFLIQLTAIPWQDLVAA